MHKNVHTSKFINRGSIFTITVREASDKSQISGQDMRQQGDRFCSLNTSFHSDSLPDCQYTMLNLIPVTTLCLSKIFVKTTPSVYLYKQECIGSKRKFSAVGKVIKCLLIYLGFIFESFAKV